MSKEGPPLARVRGSARDGEHSLTDLLLRHGLPLNARCGQRGLCRGCMVELVEGSLIDEQGRRVDSGCAVRSCRMRVPVDATVVVKPQAQARIGEAARIAESFVIDTPCQLAPSCPLSGGKDTGFAVDVGTTTVVVLVADLTSGEVLARAGDFSAQIRFGDNVISRIDAARDPALRSEMRRTLIEETLKPLLASACQRAGRDPSRLAGGTIAGNTAMLHILADVDPSPLGTAPFTPVFLAGRTFDSAQLGLISSSQPAIPLRLLPGLAAYLGADISAGIHATGMMFDPKPSLLVDMGTNGELVLHHDGKLAGCATAAGPAFEGAGLSCGTRAQAGAICGIQLHARPFDIQLATLAGHDPEHGICGSAYIDFLAEGQRHGLLAPNGRFDPDAWQQLPDPYRSESSEDGRILRLQGPDSPSISEVDIAHLLQAKAAIGAGLQILLRHCGLAATEVGKVHLAGGFGMHVNITHAIAIGLLPGFRPEQVQVVGNTSLAGALLALLDRHALEEMEVLRRDIEVIELNEQPDFEDAYIDHLALPLR